MWEGLTLVGLKLGFAEGSEACWSIAEIDYVIDRADQVLNICEIKFTKNPIVIDKSYSDTLKERLAIFKAVTKTKKSLMPILISASGALENMLFKENFQKLVTLEDMFG